MTKEIEYIINEFNNINYQITELQAEKLYKYYEMLVEKNKVMNLTAITEFEDVIMKHFIDSAIMVTKLNIPENSTILDLGTGAGFPGLPLKIVRDDLKVVLVDSLNKRINFLNEVIAELEITNIETVHSRAEDLARKPEYREQFDYCTSRAVANLSTLSEYCIPFVKVDGCFISYKSGQVEEELNSAKKAIKEFGGHITEVVDYTLPNTDIERTLVSIKKVKSTAKKYPRKAGIPAKEPI